MFWLVFFCIIFFSEQHLYYVFCLLKLDGQVLDTALVETDESETDISFDNIIVLYVFTLCLQVLQLVVCVQYFENSKGASLNCSQHFYCDPNPECMFLVSQIPSYVL